MTERLSDLQKGLLRDIYAVEQMANGEPWYQPERGIPWSPTRGLSALARAGADLAAAEAGEDVRLFEYLHDEALGDLERAAARKRADTSRALQRLEARGLVIRRDSAGVPGAHAEVGAKYTGKRWRTRWVSLTPAGREVAERLTSGVVSRSEEPEGGNG